MLKRHPWVSAGVFAGLLLAGGLAWQLSQPFILHARILSAIRSGRLTAPDDDCAIDLYAQLARQAPGARRTIWVRNQLVDRLLPQAEIVLKHLEANATVDADFPRQAKIYAFLAPLMPASGRWLAGKLYCEAHVASAQSHFRAACDAYAAALDQHPNWTLALDELGSLYARIDLAYHDRYAEDYFKRANSSDPQFVPSRVHLADLYVSQGKLELAVDCLRSALAIDAARPDLLYELGKVQHDLHHGDAAIVAMSRAAQHEKDARQRLEILRLRDEWIEAAQ